MSDEGEKERIKKPIGWLPYIIGSASFIPILGVPIGLAVITWGLLNRKQGGLKLVYLGIAGICTTILIITSLFLYSSYLREHGFFDPGLKKITEKRLNTVVSLVENYKTRHGHYPSSLEALTKENIDDQVLFDFIPWNPYVLRREPEKIHFYFYSLQEDGAHYYLRSVGRDGKPFTEDDVVPTVRKEDIEQMGLLR